MNKPQPLPAGLLHRKCDPDLFSFETTAELRDIDVTIGQERATDAIDFGIQMSGEGYNIYALGPSGLGKLSAIRQIIERQAAKRTPPRDWIYVNNFAAPDKPQALDLPAGLGLQLRNDLVQLIEDLKTVIPAAFQSEDFQLRTEELEQDLQQRHEKLLNELKEEARSQGIVLLNTPTGFAFGPMGKDNHVLSPQEFNELPEEERDKVKQVVEGLHAKLQAILRQMPMWRKETNEKIKAITDEIARYAVAHHINDVKQRYTELAHINRYLEALEDDIVAHVSEFRDSFEQQSPFFSTESRKEFFRRYQVNLLVDHGGLQHAPVIHEDLPTHTNLIGRCEYQAYMGTLMTDFTMLKPGALHQANSGFLILDAHKILLQPYAWNTLKRTLQAGEIRIQSLEQTLGLQSARTLEPEPIPLNVKVVLYGEGLLYYLLQQYDPEFRKLFKVVADFENNIERNDENSALYAQMIGSIAKGHSLRPLQRSAVMRVIEHSARAAADAERLSVHLGNLSDLLREANYWAAQEQREHITRHDVQKAIDQQDYRVNRVRERAHEEIRRGTLLIDTVGDAIAQVNGLSVIQLGGFSFGTPVRITATTRLGDGHVIDIERETELGGAIHSKGVFILSSFLASRFAKGQPLSMTASLVFEQSYSQVEGDSASLAELCALLSSLAGLAIKQCFAVTGSINQRGMVQPIGGVNEKIEGFFDVCKGLGLTGEQGVLIPTQNVKHLMLRHDVTEAAGRGDFRIFAVATVDEAMEILTGVAAGELDGENRYPPDSVNGRIDKQLDDFAASRREFGLENKNGETA